MHTERTIYLVKYVIISFLCGFLKFWIFCFLGSGTSHFTTFHRNFYLFQIFSMAHTYIFNFISRVVIAFPSLNFLLIHIRRSACFERSEKIQINLGERPLVFPSHFVPQKYV
jgi:hypothetical protein